MPRRHLALATGLIAVIFIPAMSRAGPIDEVGVGAYGHDVNDLGRGKESNTEDLQLEVDTARPPILRLIGAPRLNAFVSINSARESDFAGAGLVWDRRLLGQLYGSLDVGAGYTDGVLGPPTDPAAAAATERRRLYLGSRILFREAIGVDWRFSPYWAVGAQFWHASNGRVIGNNFNESINDAGLRLGYRF